MNSYEHLYSPQMVAEIKGKKYRQQTNKQLCELTNLSKVCNSMTMTSKEKHLANTDIEIPQHAFVTFKFLTDFVFLRSIERCRFQ